MLHLIHELQRILPLKFKITLHIRLLKRGM